MAKSTLDHSSTVSTLGLPRRNAICDIASSLNCVVAGAEVNIKKILGRNPEFASLEESKAQHVMKLVKTVFAPYWEDHGLIHENIFDENFVGEEDVDKLRNGQEKPLNKLATDCQRFMMDNHAEWQQEIAHRKSAAATAVCFGAGSKSKKSCKSRCAIRIRKCTNIVVQALLT